MLPPTPGARAWLDLARRGAAQRLARRGRAGRLLVVAGRAVALPAARAPAHEPPARRCARHGDALVAPRATPTTRSTCSPAARRLAARDARTRRSIATPARYPDEDEAVDRARRPARPRARRRSSRRTGPPRRCGCCPPRCARGSPPASIPASPRPRRRCARTGSPSRACCATPSGASRSTPARCPTRPTSSSSATPASPTGTLDPAAALRPAPPRPRRSSSTRRSWTSCPASPAASPRDALPDVIVVRSAHEVAGRPRPAGRLRGRRRRRWRTGCGPCARRGRPTRWPWPRWPRPPRRPEAAAAAAERARRERGRPGATGSRPSPGVRALAGAANFCLVEVPDGPAALGALRARGHRRAAVRRRSRDSVPATCGSPPASPDDNARLAEVLAG